jgi:two-component system, NarL family, invasion response regulator UvrY
MQHHYPLASPYRVYLLDDHALVAELLAQRLAGDSLIKIVGLGTKGSVALDFIHEHRVDIVLLDMQLEDGDGINIAVDMLKIEPRLRIIGLSAHYDTHYPSSLLEAGGRGFIAKRSSTQELIDGIRRVGRGDLAISSEIAYHFATVGEEPIARQRLGRLTDNELKILRLISCGYSVDRIATELDIAEKTVQARRNKLRRKLKVDNDVELCLLALKSGCTPLHEAAQRIHAPV